MCGTGSLLPIPLRRHVEVSEAYSTSLKSATHEPSARRFRTATYACTASPSTLSRRPQADPSPCRLGGRQCYELSLRDRAMLPSLSTSRLSRPVIPSRTFFSKILSGRPRPTPSVVLEYVMSKEVTSMQGCVRNREQRRDGIDGLGDKGSGPRLIDSTTPSGGSPVAFAGPS